MHLRAAITAVVIVSGLLAPANVRAQRGQQASLTGTVTDDTGGVLPGARVTISSPQLIGGARSHVADERGTYRFAALMPGTYLVVATHEGFAIAQRASVEVGVGMEATVDMRLPWRARKSQWTSKGWRQPWTCAAPPGRRRCSGPFSITRPSVEPLDRGPRRTRAWHRPWRRVGRSGVRDETVARWHRRQRPGDWVPRRGPEGELDRVHPGGLCWGSRRVRGVHQRPHQRRHQVRDPTSSPALANSGRPDRSGRSPTARDCRRARSGPARRSSGGTCQDRSGDRCSATGPGSSEVSTTFGSPTVRSASRDHLPEDEPIYTQSEPRVLLKLSTAPASALRLEGFVERLDGSTRNDNAGPSVTPEATSSTQYPQAFYNLRATWQMGARTLLEARYGGFNGRRTSGPATEEGKNGPAPHRDQATQVNSVNVQSFGETNSRVHAGRVVLTHQTDGGFGRGHELRAGLEYEHTSRIQEQRYPGDMLFLDRDGQPELVWIWPGAIARRFRPSIAPACSCRTSGG